MTWRSRGAGRIQTAQMNVTVQVPTTTATLPKTTPESTTSSVPALKTTEVSIKEISTKEQATERGEEKEDIEESPTAVPQVDEENIEKAGSSSTIIGIFVILIVIVVAVSGALYYRLVMFDRVNI